MSALILVLLITAGIAMLPFLALFTFLIWASIRYGSVIDRIFEERPVFLPLLVEPDDRGERVSFTSQDGLRLEGTYLKRRCRDRAGVLVFCHEYLSDRWSYVPYLDHLRDVGFDVFTFDFRNHGTSDSDPAYRPLQWTTDHEVRDLRAALDYLRRRPDRDPAGYGLFGVSRGGGVALVVAAYERDVWGVITDGAFPTRGTMTAYIGRWSEIYVQSRLLLRFVPRWIYDILGSRSLQRSGKRLGCFFPEIEQAVRRLTPRPWLQIHGARDAYIGPEIARAFSAYARQPKEMWLVPEAKHNRCRECEPEAYPERLRSFLQQYAPRRPLPLTDDRIMEDEFHDLALESPRSRTAAGFLSTVPASAASRPAAV